MSLLKRLLHQESGFTFLESVLGSAISVLVIGSIIAALFQFNVLTSHQRDVLDVSNQLSKVGTLLNHDVVSASQGTISEDGSTLTLLIPTYTFGQDSGPVTRTVTYVYSPVSDELTRSVGDGTVTVAKSITALTFGSAGPLPQVLIVQATAETHDAHGAVSESETQTLEISRRL